MSATIPNLNRPVSDFCSRSFVQLRSSLTVGEALSQVRATVTQEQQFIYFYVVDEEERLVGVVPVRRLLLESLGATLADVMISKVLTIPRTASMLEACEFFVLYKLLAFPVVDEDRRVVGVVDINLFTEEVLDLAEREQINDLFQSIGFRISEVKDASAARAFHFRFPWLLATIAGGTLCALLSGAFEVTLREALVLAFFMSLVLGLSESVSAQSMTLTLQALHSAKPDLRWLASALRKEVVVAALLGLGAGGIVGLIVIFLGHGVMGALAIAISIVFAITLASMIGVVVPFGLRFAKLDPRIAAGPVTLASADLCTLVIYFSVGTMMLAR